MFHQGSEKALHTFQDVVARFSQEEWRLLYKWQKDLYAHLMKEIHQVFLSLGPVIANSVFSLKDNEKEGLCPVYDEGSDRIHNHDLFPSATISKFDVFAISKEVVQCPKDPLKIDRLVSPKPLCRERWENPHPFGTDIIKSPDPLGTDRMHSHDPLGTDRKENPDPIGTDRRRKSHDMLSTSQMNRCKEQDFTIVMVSDSIKEEEEAYPLAEQDPEDVKNIHSPTGDSGASSGFSQRFTDQNKAFFLQAMEDEGRNIVEQSKEKSKSKKGPQTSSEYKTAATPKSTIELHQTMQTDKKLFNCTDCKRSFTERESLQVHVETLHRHMRIQGEMKPFSCTACEKRFTQHNDLRRHLRIHTGLKPFPCTECEKSFTQKAHLQGHQRIHSGVKPFPCTECEKSFTQHCDLERHKRIHTGVKPFHCTECGKSFTQTAHLQGHLRIHSGVKPFPCTECDKSFSQHCDLQRHKRIHTGLKPFHCTVCGKNFTLKTILQRHLKIHTRVQPFS